ncbi:flagellar basal body rod protein FlgB [bacterium]|nr:flagellar basal body rod protein FlgB [bacterium]
MSRIFENLLDVTEQSLSMRVKRENILAANVANSDTPGYTPMDISFEEQLKETLNKDVNSIDNVEFKQTSETHISNDDIKENKEGELFFDPSISPNNDKNSVDIDREMSKLSMNSILYNAQTTVMSKKLALLKYAASDGNR